MSDIENVQAAEPKAKKPSKREKKPAFVTQVKLLKAEIEKMTADHAAALEASTAIVAQRDTTIAKLEKDLASMISSKDHYYKGKEAAEASVEQVQLLLDTLPGTPARTISVPHYSGTTEKSLDPMTRLASYLSQRQIPGPAPAVVGGTPA